MTASEIQTGSKWPAGRIAAALLFVGGTGWAVTFSMPSEFERLFLPGFFVWALWGLRVIGFDQPKFRNFMWGVSTIWHLVWFLLSLFLFPFVLVFVWKVGLQVAWTVLALVISMRIWRGDPSKQ